MGYSKGFNFKKFSVSHDRSSMKVGTDAVLLGAWTPLTLSPLSILDVGTGCGVVALMLAQRTQDRQEVLIDAIDIDEASVEQAKENFRLSPWSERLQAYPSRLQDWHEVVSRKTKDKRLYDLIVSNPPYFVDSLTNPDSRKAAARHTQTLSYEELTLHAARLLKDGGQLSLIFPADQEEKVKQAAAKAGFSLQAELRVSPKPGKDVTRLLCSFVLRSPLTANLSPLQQHLTIEDESHPRSEAYKALTKDFYL